MPKLDIGGTQIQIGDDFLKLSPQQQDAFVKNTIIPSAEFQAAQKGAAPAPTEPTAKPRDWADVPLEAVTNIPSSAYHMAEGLVGMAAKTAKTAAPYLPYGLMAPTAMAADAAKAVYSDPDMIRRFGAAAWKGLVDRYGSEEAVKKTIATDPVGFALDAAAVIQPGASLAARGTRAIGEIAKAADVSRPFHDIPRRPEAPPALPVEPPPVPAEGAQAAVQEAIQSQPRVLTTDSRFQQQAGQVLAKMPLVGENLGKAIEAVPGRFGEARTAVADELGNYRTPQNVAGDIGEHIGGAAEAETRAATEAAARTDAAAQVAYERANLEREQAIAQREQASTQATQQQIGNVAPVVMGDAIGDTVRANHDIARGVKDRAYQDAANIDATVLDRANGGAHGAVAADLTTDSGQGRVDLRSEATSASRSMMDRLREFSEAARRRRAEAHAEAAAQHQEALGRPLTPQEMRRAGEGAAQTGQSMRNVENVRQDLNFLASGATNDADRRAARRIIGAFDDWHHGAVEGGHLMEGSDPGALDAMRRARAANRDFRERFGYNDRNDADRTLNKMVQPGNQIGPDDISKALFGGGNRPDRLIDAIHTATADHPNANNVVQAIRGGFYNKLTTAAEGVPHPPEKIASNIEKLLGDRETVNRVWNEQDRRLALNHARELRAAVRARDEAAALVKTNKPVPTEVTKGPAQELADRVLGRGQKAPEAVYDAIEGYAKSKGGGKDIATLAQVMASLPQELRGNFRNVFIRRLGTGLKGDFSPAKFADEWSTKVNPQAKAVLFGDGAHVRALDDLAAASKKFDEVHRRFGNPSGSGHTINFAKIATVAAAAATGSFLGPLHLLGGWFAGRKFANFLATPAGAASASRFATRMQRLQDAPNLANAAAARLSVRNMGNTATALGIAHNIPDTKEK